MNDYPYEKAWKFKGDLEKIWLAKGKDGGVDGSHDF